jgi:hypothetical protein
MVMRHRAANGRWRGAPPPSAWRFFFSSLRVWASPGMLLSFLSLFFFYIFLIFTFL